MKHWFYKPILDVIEAREKEVNEQITLAQAQNAEARELRESYENRLETWENEKKQARLELEREIKVQRIELSRLMNRDLEKEIEKRRALSLLESESVKRDMETQALAQARHFLAAVLTRLSRSETEKLLVDLALEEFQRTPRLLDDVRGQSPVVSSAFSLDTEHGEALVSILGEGTTFLVKPELGAGIEIQGEGHKVSLNLRDEFQLFEEAFRHAG